ncbi:SAV_2336 N-terminal domain-related protein [Actinomadura rudentiformis]|uniref:FtsK domain-containing protein n=1 Tax=Actinomadura rudentiformis TaxID=359158 RepID=A0A6H9YLL4_9ACTN|nr:SAV_2336 N-terminal domain-related protein [Actinomadura rudentiformis]KAB2342160.1 hypothetical protein F8566_39560 [Actinomadura rudentiformis]
MSVDRLKEALDAVAPDDSSLTPRDLAEMLWLACHMPAPAPQAAPPPEPDAPAEPPAAQPPPAERPEAETPTAPASTPAPAEEHELHAPRPAPEEPKGTGEGVLVPTAPMLRHPLALQRALRPLKRRVPSPRRSVLNEEATAARIADDPSSWIPVMDPADERWLSLALVIDAAPSMRIWRPLVRELRDMLLRLGAFRDVRLWHLDRTGVRPYPGGPPTRPASLIDPAGRQAVLVVSDCSGPDWWDGHIGPALHVWGTHGPTAILQPLVERLWRRSAAPVVPGLAMSSHPGAPNTDLRFVPYEGRPQNALPIPVLEIKPDWLADWTRLVTASGGEGKPTAITYVTGEPRPTAAPPHRERELPIEEQVARFYAAASTTAAELAAHVAVSVPALPVMRLIQQRLLPASRPGDLAEVLLSGLLQPVDADRGVYDFVPGAREALLATLPRPESLATADVLAEVSAEIQARAGSAAEVFRAVIPAAEGTRALADRPFALVSEDALRFLNHTAIPVRTRPAESVPAGTGMARRTEQTTWPLFALGGSELRIWDPTSESVLASWNLAGHPEADTITAVSSSGRPLLVSGHANAALCVSDVTAGRLVLDNGGMVSALTTFRDTAGRDVIASGGSDGVVRFWSPSTGAQVRTAFHAHTSAVRTMTALPHPDGRPYLATGGDDGIVQIWNPDSDAKTGILLPNQGPRGNAVLALATFTGPGRRTVLATGSRDGAIRLWYPLTGSQARAPLTGEKGAVAALTALVARDRPLLVAASGRTIQLWDPLERRSIGPPLTGHRSPVLAVAAFTLDGRPLIASIDALSLRIWDPLAGTPVGPVLEAREEARLRSLAVLPPQTRSHLVRSGDHPPPPQPPSTLLRPERQVVPFRGRERELAELTRWCLSPPDRSHAVLSGPRGQGKTRLALHLADLLAEEGWVTEYVTDAADSITIGSAGPLLVIVERDDGSDWPIDIRPAMPARTRILYLTRLPWSRPRPDFHRRLPDLEGTVAGREAAFDQAVTAFSAALGHPPRNLVRPDLSSSAYGHALTLHLAALRAVVGRERAFWEISAPKSVPVQAVGKAVALALLSKPRDLRQATELLRLLPELADLAHLPELAHWLSCAYPPEDEESFWGTVQPESLADALLAEVVPGFLSWLAEALPQDQVPHAISVLNRAAHDHPEIREALSRAVPGISEPDTGSGTGRPQLTDLLARTHPVPGRLECPIGVDSLGEPVLLDVARHGLVIGDERADLVRTLVLGLTATYDTDELAFLIADGRGGTSSPGLDELPHNAAAPLTPLPDEANRSISRLHEALQGEMVRRQEGADRLPHLLLVLENFTELMHRKPEFSDLILESTRADRDLGIHLLLASHHPPDTALRLLDGKLTYRVDFPIASETTALARNAVSEIDHALEEMARGHRLRRNRDYLARWRRYTDAEQQKVTAGFQTLWTLADPEVRADISDLQSFLSTARDRSDVLGLLPEDLEQARTALRRLGDSFASGTSSTGEGRLQVADNPPLPFTLAKGTPQARQSMPVRQLLLPPLTEPTLLDELISRTEASMTPQAVIGMVDRPLYHRQERLALDLGGPKGNVAVVGSTGSGKSTLLATFVDSLASTYTEHLVQFFLFDFGRGQLAPLASLPHVRSMTTYADPDRAASVIGEAATLLRRLVENDLAGSGPLIFLIVDEWGELVRALPPEAVQDLHRIVEQGWRSSVHVVASATGWSQFSPDMRDRFGTRLELALDSPADSLIDPGLAAEVPPGSPGRGITQAAEHFHAALPRLADG